MNKNFKLIIIGYGVQGKKRAKIAGKSVVAIVDIDDKSSHYRDVKDVPLDEYDVAFVCTSDEAKIEIIKYLLSNKKHVLVEKPILSSDYNEFDEIQNLAKINNVVCYTAYNHRFEPHYIRMAELLKSQQLGKIYSIRMFYGNGTARVVRDSLWRDQASGVLTDLGSHLLDTLDYWVNGIRELDFDVTGAFSHENKSFDHVLIFNSTRFVIQLEVSLLSWKNSFSCDVICERGSAHINSLCKWGPSTFTLRRRMLPSGIPSEEKVTLSQVDPTWEDEYQFFLSLCRDVKNNTIDKDKWLNNTMMKLSKKVNVKHVI